MKKVSLCAINNISSGSCSQDCHFCTQSAKNKASISKYKTKSIDTIVEEAGRAYANQAIGYCLVTAGKGLDDNMTDYVASVAYAVAKAYPSLSLIGCNGVASKEQLRELKKAGIKNYNHNLETSREFYPNICSTHSWDERYETCQNAKEVGLNLCTGGIYGLGESEADVLSFIASLKLLSPKSIPLNFFIPNASLKLSPTIDRAQALALLSQTANAFNDETMIMVAGGRELYFKGVEQQMFQSGANAIVIGDYLTTKGDEANEDILMLNQLGATIATSCD